MNGRRPVRSHRKPHPSRDLVLATILSIPGTVYRFFSQFEPRHNHKPDCAVCAYYGKAFA